MTKWEEDLAPYEPISGWRIFFVIACLLLGVLFSIWVAGSAHGEEALKCDFSESLITDALKSEPSRLVKRLEGAELQAFLSKMQAGGYFSGTLYKIDTLYIIKGKLLAGYHDAIDILFFIENGCIVGKIYGTALVVESLL